MSVILNFILLTIAIFAVAKFLPNIYIKDFKTALIVALVYSLINFFIGWFLIFISFPFLIITLGLFKFVINAFLLWLTDQLVKDFKVKGFGTLLLAAFLITVLDRFLRWIF